MFPAGIANQDKTARQDSGLCIISGDYPTGTLREQSLTNRTVLYDARVSNFPITTSIGKMNPKASIIATSIILLLTSFQAPPSFAQTPKKVEFYCGRTNDIYPATMLAVRGSEARTIVVWRNKFGKMSPQQRCETISRRFQAAFVERTDLAFLIPGIDRQTGQGLICAVKSGEHQCDVKRMLFALSNQQDAQEVVRGLYDSIRRTGNPVYQSSSSESIDIKELIDSLAKSRS